MILRKIRAGPSRAWLTRVSLGSNDALFERIRAGVGACDSFQRRSGSYLRTLPVSNRFVRVELEQVLNALL